MGLMTGAWEVPLPKPPIPRQPLLHTGQCSTPHVAINGWIRRPQSVLRFSCAVSRCVRSCRCRCRRRRR